MHTLGHSIKSYSVLLCQPVDPPEPGASFLCCLKAFRARRSCNTRTPNLMTCCGKLCHANRCPAWMRFAATGEPLTSCYCYTRNCVLRKSVDHSGGTLVRPKHTPFPNKQMQNLSIPTPYSERGQLSKRCLWVLLRGSS